MIRVARTNSKNRNEKRVIAKDTSASSIVTSPITTTDHDASVNGSKNGSVGNIPASDATPYPIAGMIATAIANSRPPGTDQAPDRTRTKPAAAYAR